MDTTQHLDLPLLVAAQAQKHVTLNEALTALDALVQLSVLDRTRTAPPASPAEGDRHIVAAGATGAWAGRSGQLALRLDGGWRFFKPGQGWTAWCAAEACSLVHEADAWRVVPGSGALARFDAVGIGTAADAGNPLTVRAAATLFRDAGGSCRVKLSKAAESDTASLLFQTAFAGRAEVGLCGDDNLRIKTSADGAGWRDALVIDPGSGAVGVGAAPAFPLDVRGEGQVRIGATFLPLATSGAGGIELMSDQTGDRISYIDMHACDAQGDFSARIVRLAGANGAMAIQTLGTGGLSLSSAGGAVSVSAGGADRLHVGTDGRVGIGTVTPAATLQVEGPVRVGRYTVATLPSAATVGAGAIAYIGDGPALAFSDGSAWRTAAGALL